MPKTVCVIGAGVSGLAAVKNSLDEGLQPICFEKDDDVGGLWNYHDVPKEGDPSLYNSCSINTSKEMTCYSDFPIPKDFPNFMAHRHFKSYLKLYAEHFGLMKYIKFKHIVERVEKADDFEDTGEWVITTKNLSSGKVEKRKVNFVMVCNGHLHEPNIPKFKGLEKFKGRVLHTHDYKDFRGFEGKRILMIGIGNSAADVACDLSRHAEHVYVSTRSGTFVIQRAADQGRPFDHIAVSRFRQGLPWPLLRPFLYHGVNNRYSHSKYGLSPNTRFNGGAVTISDDLPNRIILGTINVKTDVERFTEDGAIFVDGTKLDNIDVVILGTGYNFSFPFLQEDVVKVENSFPYLYELVWPADLEPLTLAIIGLVQPFGALPPILEMQTRWVTRAFSEKCKLPSAAKRMKEVEAKHAKLKAKGIDSARYSLVIFFIQYIDKLAQHIGCKPNLWKLFFTDNALWRKLFFGPCTPPQWRLEGPGCWKGARHAIENVEENTWYPLKTREAGKHETEGLYDGWINLFKWMFIFIVTCIFLRYLFSNGYQTFTIKS
ncbi:flavin-containing monooxygenase 5-like [Saccostrea echinata]|uniref:flavin-containing monooxygenase 5-like n=1 Tax=Saccostrea echinata TaxID=191078 RepID=UPI002A813D1F|nr:flavin-containing monooxygenase 5-like [Saccostrea echinata]